MAIIEKFLPEGLGSLLGSNITPEKKRNKREQAELLTDLAELRHACLPSALGNTCCHEPVEQDLRILQACGSVIPLLMDESNSSSFRQVDLCKPGQNPYIFILAV